MTGGTQTLPLWLGEEGKDDRNKIHLAPLIGSLQSANVYAFDGTPIHAP